MPPATGQRSRQLGLGKIHSAADVDHGLDFTHGTLVGRSRCRRVLAAVATLEEGSEVAAVLLDLRQIHPS
jgi:hypothetical protein